VGGSSCEYKHQSKVPSTSNARQLIATFLGFVAVSGLSLHGYATTGHGGIYGNTSNAITLNSNTIILFAFVLAVAFALSWLYLLAARAFTKQFIWITGILNIVIGVGTAIYYLYRHYWSAGIVFAIFAVFSIFCFISWLVLRSVRKASVL
jgi:hypothetical protein